MNAMPIILTTNYTKELIKKKKSRLKKHSES